MVRIKPIRKKRLVFGDYDGVKLTILNSMGAPHPEFKHIDGTRSEALAQFNEQYPNTNINFKKEQLFDEDEYFDPDEDF